MKRRAKLGFGTLLAVAGVCIALFPFVSVWQVAAQVLDELPHLPGVESSDTSHEIGALVNDEFVLATRTYPETTREELHDALIGSGFDVTSINGTRHYVEECCGEYDAVLVTVNERNLDDVIVVSATAADQDIQSAAPLFGLFGLAVFLAGITIAVHGRSQAGNPTGE